MNEKWTNRDFVAMRERQSKSHAEFVSKIKALPDPKLDKSAILASDGSVADLVNYRIAHKVLTGLTYRNKEESMSIDSATMIILRDALKSNLNDNILQSLSDIVDLTYLTPIMNKASYEPDLSPF